MNFESHPSKMKVLLCTLLASLEPADGADPEYRALLVELEAAIHRVLQTAGADPAPPDDPLESLRAVARRFAVRHPRLEPVLEDIVGLLSSIGI